MDGGFPNGLGAGTIDDDLLLDDLTYGCVTGHHDRHVVPETDCYTDAHHHHPFADDPYAVSVPGVAASEWPRSSESHRQINADSEDPPETDWQARLRALTRVSTADVVQEPPALYTVYGGEEDSDDGDGEEVDPAVAADARARMGLAKADEDHSRHRGTSPPQMPSALGAGAMGGGIDDGFTEYASTGYEATTFSMVSGSAQTRSSRPSARNGSEPPYHLDPQGGLIDDRLDVFPRTRVVAVGPTHSEPGGTESSSYRPHDAFHARRDSPKAGGVLVSGDVGFPAITVTPPSRRTGRLVMTASAAEAAESFLAASQRRQSITDGNDEASRAPPPPTASSTEEPHVPSTAEHSGEGRASALQVPSSSGRSHHARPSTRVAGSVARGGGRGSLPHTHSLETCEGSCGNRSIETLDSLAHPSSTLPDEDGDDDHDDYTSDEEEDVDDDEEDGEEEDGGTACGSVRTVSTTGGSFTSHGLVRSSTGSTALSTPTSSHHNRGAGHMTSNHEQRADTGLVGGGGDVGVRGGRGLAGSGAGPRHRRPGQRHKHRLAVSHPHGAHQHHHHHPPSPSLDVSRQVSTLSVSDETVASAASQASSYRTNPPHTASLQDPGSARRTVVGGAETVSRTPTADCVHHAQARAGDGASGGVKPPVSPSSSREPATLPTALPNAEDVLSRHNKHVFVMTSAGKPVFSRYGDANELSALFGLLQVLMSISGDGEEGGPSTIVPPGTAQACAGDDHRLDDGGLAMIRHIYSRTWRVADNGLVPASLRRGGNDGESNLRRYLQNEVDPLGLFEDDDDGEEDNNPMSGVRREEEEGADLHASAPPFTFHMLRQGELCLVMATRHLDESASYCTWQLKLVHLFLLSVLPNVHEMLRDAPSHDVRRHFSSGDFDLLRALLKRCSNDVSYLAGHMEWAVTAAARSTLMDRSCPRRTWFAQLVARYHQRAVPVDARMSTTSDHPLNTETRSTANNPHHLFSFVFYHGRLVVAVGDRPSGGSGVSTHGLATEDLFLLEHFAAHVARRQRGGGANWAPICLPCFNRTGYVWAYVCDLSTRMRESWWATVLPSSVEDDAVATAAAAPSPALPLLVSAEGKVPGLLYVQVSASPHDSGYCDENTSQLCHDLLKPVRGGGSRAGGEPGVESSVNVSPWELGSQFFRFEEDVAGRPLRGGQARLIERYREEQPAEDSPRSDVAENDSNNDGEQEEVADSGRGVHASTSRLGSSSSSSFTQRRDGAWNPLASRPSLIRHLMAFATHMDESRGSVACPPSANAPPPPHAVAAVRALHHLPSLEDQLFCLQWFSLVGASDSVAAASPRSQPHDRTHLVGLQGLLTSSGGGCESTLLSVGKRERKSVLRRLNAWMGQLRCMPRDPAHFACLLVEEVDFAAVLLTPTVAVMTSLCQQVYPSVDAHSVTTNDTAPKRSVPAASSSSSSRSSSPAFDLGYAQRCPYPLAHPPYVFSEFLEAAQTAVKELVVVFLPGTAEAEMLYWAMRLLHGAVTLQADLFVPLHVTTPR